MSQPAMRVFSTEFKAGRGSAARGWRTDAAVADELKIKRKLLYEWRAAYRAMGVAGLNRKRGPKPGYLAARASPDAAPAPDAPSELARAKARIAELERKIGKQQMDLDFFREALRLIDALEADGGQDQRDVLYAVIETMSAQENGMRRKAAPRSTICARWRTCPAPVSIASASFATPSGRKPTCATKSRPSR